MTSSSRRLASDSPQPRNNPLYGAPTARRSIAAHLALVLTLAPAVTHAQGTASDCQPFVLNGPVAECSASGSPLDQLRTATFIAGSEAAGETLARAIALEVATAPYGSSSGGFTFTLNPITRVYSRRSGTFGPAFSERALTIGKGELSVGFNYLHRSYSELDGLPLDGFDVFRFHGGTLPVTSSRLELEVTTDTFAGFASYGVSDNLDVGVLVPYVWLSVEGVSRIYGVSNDELQRVFLDAPAGGVGDVALFGKYRFWTLEPPSGASEEVRGGLAGTVTLRLPTGSEDDLVGLGVTRTAFSLVGSTTIGRVSPHINLGYEYWSNGFDIPTDFQGLSTVAAKDQFQYSAGFEYRGTCPAIADGRCAWSLLARCGQRGLSAVHIPAEFRQCLRRRCARGRSEWRPDSAHCARRQVERVRERPADGERSDLSNQQRLARARDPGGRL